MSRSCETKQLRFEIACNNAKQTTLYDQHLNKASCDVVIQIKESEFFVHSSVIAASCPKLQNLIDEYKLKLTSTNCKLLKVDLDESLVSANVFEFMLAYMYLGVFDWNNIPPDLENKALSAASWCGFHQILDDYMSNNDDKDNDDGMAGSTIIMVDTCDDSERIEESDHEEIVQIESDSQNVTPDIMNNEIEALYCVLCGVQFDLGDEIALAEHMQCHAKTNQNEPTTRRNVTRRKASLGLKQKYKSLIPNYKADSDLSQDYNGMNDNASPVKSRRSTKNQGRVLLFKNSFHCQHCNKKLASQKALDHHLRNLCPLRGDSEENSAPLTMEEMASHLLTELANDEPEGSSLRSTKGLTVQTGEYVRPYVKKRGQTGNDELDTNAGKKIKTTKLWICPHCPHYVFERKRDQIRHIRSVHGVIKRHVCEQCGKSLEGKTALALHMRIHTGERPFVCSTCGQGFSERQTMEGHMRRHTGEKPFLCTECGKSFPYRQSLYRHMKFHTGQKPHECPICGKTFVIKQNMQEHVIRHEKHQLMECIQCGMKFANKELLLKHQLEIHVIEDNTHATEFQEGQPHELEYIDVNEFADTPDGGQYQVTIDNEIFVAYES